MPTKSTLLPVVIVLAILLTGCPGCFLDRSGIVSPTFQWTCRATIRVPGGADVVLTSDDPVFASDLPVFAIFDDADGSTVRAQEFIQDRWRRYLRTRLEGSDLPPTLREMVGLSGWCLLSDQVTRTATQAEARLPELAEMPLEGCTGTGTGCGNPEGVVPQIAFEPAGVDFGDVPIGTDAPPRAVTVRNAGDGQLCLDSPRIDGEDPMRPEFTVDTSGCAPASDEELMRGQVILSASRPTCTLGVRFHPRLRGPRTQTLEVTTDPASTIGSVPLRGTGLPGRLTGPSSLCLNTAPFIVEPGRTCTRNTLSLTNDGPGVVTVSLPALASDGTAANWIVESPTMTVALPPGGSLPITVVACEPSVNTILTIMSDDEAGVRDVQLLARSSGCAP